MNEEEKKAIEKLTNNKKMTLIELIRKIKKEGIERFIVTRPEYIYTILNLLEKKDKESHFIQSELDIANAKIIELNKIIDLMSEEFRTKTLMYSDMSKEEIKQYFERKVENGN